MQFSNEALAHAQKEGFAICNSKGKARLIDEILSLRPVALVVDSKYCEQRSMKSQFLLQKVQHSLGNTPVFLMNATDVDYVQLMAENLIYAMMKGKPDLVKLVASLRRYLESNKRRASSATVRNLVALPCLLKKLGASGLLQGQICDLSPKGMKILLERPREEWAVGDEIRFSVAKAGASGAHLDGYGRLRWAEKINDVQGSVKMNLGIEFSQLPLPTLYEFLDILNSSRANA
jgi:hypothetical protein